MNTEYFFSIEEFGLRLSRLRESKGVSARQMSLEIGLNKNYINSIESGRNYPNMAHFFEICQYLSIACGLPPHKFHHLYLLACDMQDD